MGRRGYLRMDDGAGSITISLEGGLARAVSCLISCEGVRKVRQLKTPN
jgi:hypothetical protein